MSRLGILLPVRPPSLTYLSLGVLMYLKPGTSCRFPVTRRLAPGNIIFVTPTALKLLKLATHSKSQMYSRSLCIVSKLNLAIPMILNIKVKNKSSFFSIDISVKSTFL